MVDPTRSSYPSIATLATNQQDLQPSKISTARIKETLSQMQTDHFSLYLEKNRFSKFIHVSIFRVSTKIYIWLFSGTAKCITEKYQEGKNRTTASVNQQGNIPSTDAISPLPTPTQPIPQDRESRVPEQGSVKEILASEIKNETVLWTLNLLFLQPQGENAPKIVKNPEVTHLSDGTKKVVLTFDKEGVVDAKQTFANEDFANFAKEQLKKAVFSLLATPIYKVIQSCVSNGAQTKIAQKISFIWNSQTNSIVFEESSIRTEDKSGNILTWMRAIEPEDDKVHIKNGKNIDNISNIAPNGTGWAVGRAMKPGKSEKKQPWPREDLERFWHSLVWQ